MHIAPQTLEMASMFAILTRLHPNPKCDPITKLRLYSGEKVVEKGKLGRVDARELRDDTRDEEMDDISTRFTMKALDNALSDDIGARCLTPINARKALIKMAEKADLPPEVIAYRWSSNRRGETLFYRSYEPPKEAIEKRLVTSVREVSRVVTKTSSPEHWRHVKETLVRSVGVGSLPVIKVENSSHGGNSTLLLRHYRNGRGLDLGSAKKTLAHVRWNSSNSVILETQLEGNPIRLEGLADFEHEGIPSDLRNSAVRYSAVYHSSVAFSGVRKAKSQTAEHRTGELRSVSPPALTIDDMIPEVSRGTEFAVHPASRIKELWTRW